MYYLFKGFYKNITKHQLSILVTILMMIIFIMSLRFVFITYEIAQYKITIKEQIIITEEKNRTLDSLEKQLKTPIVTNTNTEDIEQLKTMLSQVMSIMEQQQELLNAKEKSKTTSIPKQQPVTQKTEKKSSDKAYCW